MAVMHTYYHYTPLVKKLLQNEQSNKEILEMETPHIETIEIKNWEDLKAIKLVLHKYRESLEVNSDTRKLAILARELTDVINWTLIGIETSK